jgi:hypothetical protein
MMMGHFPNPHPDELFYSICARYNDRMQYSIAYATSEALFGRRKVELTFDLPSYLDRFVAALPPGHSCTVDKLIDDHTLLPYYRPFLPLERLQRLRNDMRGEGGGEVLWRAGIANFSVSRPKALRFCPHCVDDDRKNFGECYWHRVHQISGVEICPIHENYLQESSTLIRYQGIGNTFISAESAIRPTFLRQHDLPKRDQEILLKIARDAQWLLGQQCLSSDIESLHKRCIAILSDRGFTTYNDHIHRPKLYQAFRDHFPPSILSLLHCELNEYRQNVWFFRLIQSKKTVKRPLLYLLLMHLCKYSAQDFFNLPVPDKCDPFGEGPWPCLNPFCVHFREPHIREIHVIYGQKGGKPLGTFSCVCGFVYGRKGPDLTPDDRLRISRVRSYGRIWEDTLQKLWNDPRVSLTKMACQLGISRGTVNYQARRLGLPFPRGNCTPSSSAHNFHTETTQASYSIKLAEYQAAWLALLKEQHGVVPLRPRQKGKRLYNWLHSNDRNWLHAHLPEHLSAGKKGIKKDPRIDWKTRDAQLSETVKTSALRLRNATGGSMRITIAAIARDSGQSISLLRNRLDKLPLTAEALADIVETHEEFAIRRVRWAADLYHQENTYPKRWQLVRRAGVEGFSERPQVKDAIDAALESLNPLNSADNPVISE